MYDLSFEIKKMLDYVARFGGYREKEIVKDIETITIEMNTKEHKVFRVTNKDGYSFEYDVITNKIVG